MVFALWVLAAWFFIVIFGTLALQLVVVLVQIAVQLLVWTTFAVIALVWTLHLAVTDRRELARVWREATPARPAGATRSVR